MSTPASSAATKQILVVEDHPMNQKFIGIVLERIGHQATYCGHGEEALAAIHARHFDAIIMDIQMPVMDGLEATRAIRALGSETADVLIVALTSDTSDEARRKALEAGVDEFVKKPVEYESLKAALQRSRVDKSLRRHPVV